MKIISKKISFLQILLFAFLTFSLPFFQRSLGMDSSCNDDEQKKFIEEEFKELLCKYQEKNFLYAKIIASDMADIKKEVKISEKNFSEFSDIRSKLNTFIENLLNAIPDIPEIGKIKDAQENFRREVRDLHCEQILINFYLKDKIGSIYSKYKEIKKITKNMKKYIKSVNHSPYKKIIGTNYFKEILRSYLGKDLSYKETTKGYIHDIEENIKNSKANLSNFADIFITFNLLIKPLLNAIPDIPQKIQIKNAQKKFLDAVSDLHCQQIVINFSLQNTLESIYSKFEEIENITEAIKNITLKIAQKK